jgi:hypothetical protein
MQKAILNFKSFELPFFTEIKDKRHLNISDDDNEEDDDNDLIKENMESRIPKSAVYLGLVETEVENMTTSWKINDEYYIYPLQDDDYNWAVFRISWDDNWGRWDWIPDGRLKGLSANYKEAARLILGELWEEWQVDLDDPENEAYLNMLEQM